METKTKSTQDVIMEQLQENTGRSICDSGDHYGRHWEKNQGKTWEDFTRNPTRLEAHVYTHGDKPQLELLGYVSLASWLDANVEYSQKMQDLYEAWGALHDPDNDMYDMQRMEAFAESMGGKSMYGDSRINYTYNDENDLSQDIQFIEFVTEIDGDDTPFVLIQVHGGCDARGGMGSPKAYEVKCEYFGRWSIDGYGCDSKQWDEDLSDSSSHLEPGLKDYALHDLVWVPTLEHDLECLAQTDKNSEATKAAMRLHAATLEREYFEEFCEALTEHSVVVFKGVAHFVGDDGPEEIWCECSGLHG